MRIFIALISVYLLKINLESTSCRKLRGKSDIGLDITLLGFCIITISHNKGSALAEKAHCDNVFFSLFVFFSSTKPGPAGVKCSDC